MQISHTCLILSFACSFTVSRRGEANVYLSYLKSLQNKEEEANIANPKINDLFDQYLFRNKTQESYYLLEKMKIGQNLIYNNIKILKENSIN